MRKKKKIIMQNLEVINEPLYIADTASTKKCVNFDTQLKMCSKNRDDDKYDEFGKNISAQERRQNLEPWVIVKRSKS
jgi:hypothetical protein